MSATLAPDSASESKPAPKSTPPQSVIATLLTMLGSTGVISVYGPITGELFWEGHLSPSGLASTEFPASDSEIRMYAFKAIAIALTSIWSQFGKALLIVIGLIVLAAALYLVMQRLPKRIKEWARQKGAAVVAWTGNRRSAVMAGAFVLGGVAMSALAMMFLTAAVILILSPFYARSAGEQAGIAELKRMLAPGTPCMSVLADGFTFKCPHVIAYGKDYLGVLDGYRVHRVQRDKAVVSSPLPAHKRP